MPEEDDTVVILANKEDTVVAANETNRKAISAQQEVTVASVANQVGQPQNAFKPLSLKSTVTPSTGVVVDKKFEIIEELGKGGMCTVYKAKHLVLEREVALKMLHAKLVIDGEAKARFLREAQAIDVLEHKNIVKVFGYGFDFGKPYMAMEYLEGKSLADLLKEEIRLSKERALPIFEQILDALAHAHAKGIIHRDLKPSNVMLVGDGSQVKLVDFGIAKILPESGKELETLTLTGDLLGTALYMSPEQCSGNELDARSDLYSMGCLMYEVLDGEPPLQGNNCFATFQYHIHEEPRKSKFITGDFGTVVLRALGKDPKDRPQTAEELKDALNDPASFVEKHVSKKQTPKSYASKRGILLGLVLVVVSAALLTVRWLPGVSQLFNGNRYGTAFYALKSSRKYNDMADPKDVAIPLRVSEFASLVQEYNAKMGHSAALTVLNRWEKIHAKGTQSSDTLCQLITICADLGDSNAAKHYADVVFANKVAHNSAYAAITLARMYQRVKQPVKGIAIIKSFPELLNSDYGVPLLSEEAQCYQACGKYTDAGKALERAVNLYERKKGEDEGLASILFQRAYMYRLEKKCSEAQSWYDRCLRIREKVLTPRDPALPTTLYETGYNLQLLKKYTAAKTYFERALECWNANSDTRLDSNTDPHFAETYCVMGELFQIVGDCSRAKILYRRSLKIWRQDVDHHAADIKRVTDALSKMGVCP